MVLPFAPMALSAAVRISSRVPSFSFLSRFMLSSRPFQASSMEFCWFDASRHDRCCCCFLEIMDFIGIEVWNGRTGEAARAAAIAITAVGLIFMSTVLIFVFVLFL